MLEEVKSGQLGVSGSSQGSIDYGLSEQSGQVEQPVESGHSERFSQTEDENTTVSEPEEPMDKQAMAPILERFPDLAKLDDLDDAQQIELLGKVLTGLQEDLNREGK
ncbi:hypothetical protein DKK74_05160 [Bifidobacterium asteroides]|uniref:Uncharacterized protein n=1 Tax=Bifidobacterium asteroides TaxID=1684 RepID=A0A318MKA6_9BIFI|nr:hypothetical protein DKK74_05160 [Bifidobacterium asteroides]